MNPRLRDKHLRGRQIVLTKNTGSFFKGKTEILAFFASRPKMGTARHWQKPLVTLNCAHRFVLPFQHVLPSFAEVTCSCPTAPHLSHPRLYHMHVALFKSLFPWALGTLWGPKANCSFLSPLLSATYQTPSPASPTDLFLPLFLAVSLLISFLQVSLSLFLSHGFLSGCSLL